MKGALINLPRLVFKDIEFCPSSLPLAMANLRGYLDKEGIDTKLFDLNIILMENKELFCSFNKIDSRLGVEEFISKNYSLIKKVVEYLISKIDIEDCGILGVSIVEPQQIKIMIPFMRRVKEIYPEKKIVVGGLFSHLIRKEYFVEKTVDFLIRGHGEEIFLLIIEAIQNEKDYFNKTRERYKPLHKEFDLSNQITMFDNVRIDNYRFIHDDYNLFNDLFNSPILPYKISEGCLYNCTFCSAYPKEINYKKPKQIVEELKKIKDTYNYKYFLFLHQHLTISESFIRELCDLIIDSKLDILWCDCIKPLGYLSQELYYKLRKAGCIRLSYGIETGSPKIMKLMDKGHSIPDCEKSLKYAHKAGIWTEAHFIEGFPGESEKEFNETLDFIKRNKDYIDIATGDIFRLEKAGSIIKNPKKYGIRVKKRDMDNRFIGLIVYEYDEIGGLSYGRLQKLHKSRLEKFSKFLGKIKPYNLFFGSKTMIFPLYDLLNSKDKVMKFLIENYDIIDRFHKEFYSLFTGTLSNQKIKGNLHHSSIDEFKSVPYERLIRRTEEIYSDGYKKLIIVGGEPLIREDIFKVLSAAKNIGFEYIIVKTNARMLRYQEFCEKLSKSVDEILVINPSENEKKYEAISGTKDSFSQAMEGINNWKKLNKKIRYYS